MHGTKQKKYLQTVGNKADFCLADTTVTVSRR